MKSGTSQAAKVSADFGYATPDYDEDMYALPVVIEGKTAKASKEEVIRL